MKIITFIVTLMIVAPAFGQSRVFTNADLGKPLSRSAAAKADQAAAILAPYQFVAVPREWLLGPTVTVLNSSPTAGPFGEFTDFSPTRRLDGSLSTDPLWGATNYGGWPPYWVGGGAMPLGYRPPRNGQWRSATPISGGRPQPQARPASANVRGAARADGRRITPR